MSDLTEVLMMLTKGIKSLTENDEKAVMLIDAMIVRIKSIETRLAALETEMDRDPLDVEDELP